jgi:serine/threonine protein kinase
MERVRSKQIPKYWDPTGKAILIAGIALGMRFVHSKRIIHGDLKPSNILINSRGETLIGDFGASRIESNETTEIAEAATVHYAAPELFRGDAMLTQKVDVFAFGLVLYEILKEHPAFDISAPVFTVMKRILKREMPPIPTIYGDLMRNLMAACWSYHPNNRPTFDMIIREFKAWNFRIIPGANPERVQEYIKSIEDWESVALRQCPSN